MCLIGKDKFKSAAATSDSFVRLRLKFKLACFLKKVLGFKSYRDVIIIDGISFFFLSNTPIPGKEYYCHYQYLYNLYRVDIELQVTVKLSKE